MEIIDAVIPVVLHDYEQCVQSEIKVASRFPAVKKTHSVR